MSVLEKLVGRVLSGRYDATFRFVEIARLLRALGFAERVRGDHHIFWRNGVEEILNLQPKGSQAKPYQVKQVREIIVKYGLEVHDA